MYQIYTFGMGYVGLTFGVYASSFYKVHGIENNQKAAENIIKMVTASQKMVAQEEETQVTMSQSDILSVLDSEGIAPSRFLPQPVDEKKNKEKPDFSANFTALKKQSQQNS